LVSQTKSPVTSNSITQIAILTISLGIIDEENNACFVFLFRRTMT